MRSVGRASLAALVAFGALPVLMPSGAVAEEEPKSKWAVATEAAQERGWTTDSVLRVDGQERGQTIVRVDDDSFQVQIALAGRTMFDVRTFEQDPSTKDDDLVLSYLTVPERLVLGKASTLRWADASTSFGTLFGTAILAGTFSPAAAAAFAEEQSLTGSTEDGGSTFAFDTEGVRLDPSGNASFESSEDGTDPFPDSSSRYELEAGSDDVMRRQTLTTTFNNGTRVVQDSAYTYGPVEVAMPEASLVLPAGDYAIVSEAARARTVVGAAVRRATVVAASLAGRWTQKSFRTRVQRIVTVLLDGDDLDVRVLALRGGRVAISAADEWNDRRFTRVFTVANGTVTGP